MLMRLHAGCVITVLGILVLAAAESTMLDVEFRNNCNDMTARASAANFEMCCFQWPEQCARVCR